MLAHPPIPVLRIFDLSLARSFYLDWLGFHEDWLHRFSDGAPAYLQVARGAVRLHLSEHFADASPGARVYIRVDDVRALHAELATRPNPRMRPGIEEAPWGALVLTVVDPFSNHLLFAQPH